MVVVDDYDNEYRMCTLKIAVVRRLLEMCPKSMLRRLNTLRRLFNTLPADMWATLKNSGDLLCFSSQNGVRRLLRPGPKSVLRRLKKSRRLMHFPSSQLCPTHKTHDGNS